MPKPWNKSIWRHERGKGKEKEERKPLNKGIGAWRHKKCFHGILGCAILLINNEHFSSFLYTFVGQSVYQITPKIVILLLGKSTSIFSIPCDFICAFFNAHYKYNYHCLSLLFCKPICYELYIPFWCNLIHFCSKATHIVFLHFHWNKNTMKIVSIMFILKNLLFIHLYIFFS